MYSQLRLLFLAIGLVGARPQDPPKPAAIGKAGSGGGNALLDTLAAALGKTPPPNNGPGLIDNMCKTHDGTDPVGNMIEAMFGSISGKGPDEKCTRDDSGGSGPHKANFTEIASLPGHTVYRPLKAPANETLPVIIWSNGFCMAAGAMFYNFLNEIASHGFVVISNGPAYSEKIGQTSYRDMIASIDWVSSHADAKKLGNLDLSRLTVSGQSCGGGEAATTAANDARVKHVVFFNSGGIATAKLMGKPIPPSLPVAWFEGGKSDMAYAQGAADWYSVPATTPALWASIDNGHIGSYYQKHAGKMGKAAVAYLKWQLKGDESQKKLFCKPAADSALVQLGFSIEAKGGLC